MLAPLLRLCDSETSDRTRDGEALRGQDYEAAAARQRARGQPEHAVSSSGAANGALIGALQ